MTDIAELVKHARSDGRVCPLPPKWNALWQVLSSARTGTGSEKPPPPLILAAWHETTDEEKRRRVREQLLWANDNRILEAAADFLMNLPESQWHHE